MVPRMKRLIATAALLVAATGCNQEHNKSIEIMNKGVEEGRQKLFDSAIRDLKTATTIDPSNAAAYYNMGIIYKDEHKWTDAADAFNSSLRLDPENPALHYELGNALFEQAKVTEAQAEFEKALKIDPKLYKAHYRLGVTLQVQDKLREADAEFRKAIEANPRFVPPYLKLGDMYLDNDYDKEAAQVFQNAILADESNGEAHQGYAEALQKQKQYEEAIKEFQKAVSNNGELYLAYYNIGHTYKMLGDKKNAKEWLDKFIKGYSTKAGPELAKAASDEMYALDAP
jgi:tetratricopeptide (TPR) repeat protein